MNGSEKNRLAPSPSRDPYRLSACNLTHRRVSVQTKFLSPALLYIQFIRKSEGINPNIAGIPFYVTRPQCSLRPGSLNILGSSSRCIRFAIGQYSLIEVVFTLDPRIGRIFWLEPLQARRDPLFPPPMGAVRPRPYLPICHQIWTTHMRSNHLVSRAHVV